ncbi:MAG: UDP-N-acetylglucosamine 1-carboxyvinyltransferase [Phycisphaerales bacterium]|nr:MAG: UDP-N-acetylglucosamine 1-carboxyvinyltransferase [Phycisphaerales bacterium]
MDEFRIQGGTRLAGRIRIDGSKNASLPLTAAALLAGEPVTLRNVPDLSDISNLAHLMGELGCRVDRGEGTMTIEEVDPSCTHARYEIVSTMRASICVLGPLLAKRKQARVAMPGGCAFGARPVDLHLRGLRALGAQIELSGGDIIAKADRLKGATIFLGGPFGSTVLGTANVMSAATLAEGRTIIESAACEPEIADVARLLNAMGAKISGAGSPRITIDGVEELGGADHIVIPDRIVAATYAVAAAITNGDVTLEYFPHDCLLAPIDLLQNVGVNVNRLDMSEEPTRCTVQVTSERRLKPGVISTQPYPGFPTDLQAQMMALLCLADGNSIITEKIFPERFMHVAELTRMGAQLIRQGPTVMVQGVRRLFGAPVMASDLRASACLVLAGMVAEGETIVSRVYHLDRGYARMEEVLNSLGANIQRFNPERKHEPEPPVITTVPAAKAKPSTVATK